MGLPESRVPVVRYDDRARWVIGSPIHDPSLPPEADDTAAGRTQFNHIHEKLLDLPNRMYTDAGEALADERATFVRQFARRLEREVAGVR